MHAVIKHIHRLISTTGLEQLALALARPPGQVTRLIFTVLSTVVTGDHSQTFVYFMSRSEQFAQKLRATCATVRMHKGYSPLDSVPMSPPSFELGTVMVGDLGRDAEDNEIVSSRHHGLFYTDLLARVRPWLGLACNYCIDGSDRLIVQWLCGWQSSTNMTVFQGYCGTD